MGVGRDLTGDQGHLLLAGQLPLAPVAEPTSLTDDETRCCSNDTELASTGPPDGGGRIVSCWARPC